ncbi:MAG: ACP S-malonyltransferase [Deltaproteobacteria bacterium]|nr:ACP S-malonyltransferase [Deltaproteobacteria bacterium]
MGKQLYDRFGVARDVFGEAEEAAKLPLKRLCFSGPEADLKLTEHTQPAMLTVSVAALRVIESETSLRPFCVAGHSLGEYSALVSVGGLGFADAVRVVRERGRLMQEAVPDGEGMMAVFMGLEPQAVQAICEEAGEKGIVSPANFNGGGQIVIAGSRPAVLQAMALAKERGIRRVLELPVSAPFHCSLMAPASDGLRTALAEVTIRPFSIGVITNVEATVNLDWRRVKGLLVEQAVRPVQWEASIKQLERLGCDRVLEIGPGKVLSGLIRRISPGISLQNIEVPEDLEKVLNN